MQKEKEEQLQKTKEEEFELLVAEMNTAVETAQSVVFSAGSIPGMGKEPEVLGTIAARALRIAAGGLE